MREVWIRNRPDGVTEISPRIAPLERGDRWLVIVTVVLSACGFFTTGVMPVAALAAVVAACLAGELVLGAKALLLVVLRPLAEVHQVPGGHLRRRGR